MDVVDIMDVMDAMDVMDFNISGFYLMKKKKQVRRVKSAANIYLL